MTHASQRRLESVDHRLNPSMAKRPMHIELLGRRISLVSDASEERTKEIASLVNERLEQARGAAPKASLEQLALLSALNLAEELLAERARQDELKTEVRTRSLQLIGALDQIALEVERSRGLPPRGEP